MRHSNHYEKIFFTLLAMALSVPSLLAEEMLQRSVVQSYESSELLTTDSSASVFKALKADDAYTDWEYVGMAHWTSECWKGLMNLGATGENHFKVNLVLNIF